jgi:(2R)-sulfolactate sulfo-lyase subunit beta
MAIPHPYGRLQFGADLDLHFRTLIGTGCNPNVAAVVVIGIEDGWTKRWSKASPPPASPWSVSASKATATTRPSRASRLREFVQDASELQRVECPISELWVSTKCGEIGHHLRLRRQPDRRQRVRQAVSAGNHAVFGETSEITGGEQLSPRAAERRKCARLHDHVRPLPGDDRTHKTSDLSDSQPTKGNIAGGLTTIEEKALGNIQKIGRTCKIDGVLDKAEAPTGPGLWFMDSSSPPPRW